MLRKLLLLSAAVLAANSAIADDRAMRAHFLDVGQGACTLLEFPCGAILIDTGGQDEAHALRLGRYLADFFERRADLNHTLNAVIVSHPHIDHTRGIKTVFAVCKVQAFIDNGFQRGSGRHGVKYVRDHQHEHNAVILEIDDDEIINLQERTGFSNQHIDSIECPHCDPDIRILSGGLQVNPGSADREFDNLNNHSLVVRVDFGESSFLFTGDLEVPAIETMVNYYDGTDLLDVDVQLVGHHGSHNGITESLVTATSPDIAVIPVGKSTFGADRNGGFNTYAFGHPRRSVVELLSSAIPGRRSRGIDVQVADKARTFSDCRITQRIYATGWDGDVTVTAKLDGSMRVTTGATEDWDAAPLVAAVSPLMLGPAVEAVADAAASGERYGWNLNVPEKRPTSGGNGKVILFDLSHGGTAGQSDWVIDGAFSDFADALVSDGYTVREYRGVDKNGDGAIRFFDDRQFHLSARNEAVIEFGAIQDAHVFVMAESNRPLREDERAALFQFVAAGKGLFLIGDHYNADRNLNSWDATEVFNGYNRSTSPQFNLGGFYGDLRNPEDATKGWLAENFGLRFRFNAVNCKDGVSDIVPPDEAERLTDGVAPLLMAAGATLAIVDPAKAKGLVYLRDSDNATSWPNAVEGREGGFYFGGRNEGPYVAISKPSRGKAAFIGDSSPIEDKTARYRNEIHGGRKNLHDGWNDPGNAARLCRNLIDWLATPEDYVGFNDANGHPPGTTTPDAMAVAERSDPHDGRPWRTPPSGYSPWDTDTFSPGSYGAPLPDVSSAGPNGAPSGLLTVAQGLSVSEGTRIVVIGVIQAEHNDQYGLRLADSLGATEFLTVQIPRDFRQEFSPRLNPTALGRKVRITGLRGRYTGLPGIRNVAAVEPVDGT